MLERLKCPVCGSSNVGHSYNGKMLCGSSNVHLYDNDKVCCGVCFHLFYSDKSEDQNLTVRNPFSIFDLMICFPKKMELITQLEKTDRKIKDKFCSIEEIKQIPILNKYIDWLLETGFIEIGEDFVNVGDTLINEKSEIFKVCIVGTDVIKIISLHLCNRATDLNLCDYKGNGKIPLSWINERTIGNYRKIKEEKDG